MDKIRAFILLSGFISASITGLAQDPQFSQFYAIPLYANPAFAGASGNIRINGAYRDQYVGIANNFKTYYAAIDANANKLNGGIGFSALTDIAGDGKLTTTQVSGVYAFHVALNRYWRMRTAIQATFVQKSYDYSKFNFGDEIDDRYGFIKPTMEPIGSQQRVFPNFATGILVYSDRAYGGFAIHNLIEPNQSFYYPNSGNEQFKLPRRYTAHAGLNIYLTNQRNEKDRVMVSPNILFMNQRNYNQLNLGVYLKRQALTTGLWLRQTSKNADAAIILIGLKFPKFRIGYTYDVTISGARTATQGSHEISMAVEITPKKKPKARNKAIVCPEF